MRKIYDQTHNSEVREFDICPTLVARMGTGGGMVPLTIEPISIKATAIERKPQNGGNGLGIESNVVPTLTADGDKGPTISETRTVFEAHAQDARYGEKKTCPAITRYFGTGGGNVPLTIEQLRVRRLTVTECERLQGFPDGYTKISWKGKPEDQCPDGPRYKAIGNSWAVPVIRWIGRRMMEEMKYE